MKAVGSDADPIAAYFQIQIYVERKSLKLNVK